MGVNVTLTLSTPEHPEVHAVTHSHVESVRYTADSPSLDMIPGLRIRLKDRVHRYDLACVLDVLVIG